MRQLIGQYIQCLIGERASPGPDGDPFRIPGDLLLEPLRDRLLDLFFLEFDEGAIRVKALGPNGPLFRRKIGHMSRHVTHLSFFRVPSRFDSQEGALLLPRLAIL